MPILKFIAGWRFVFQPWTDLNRNRIRNKAYKQLIDSLFEKQTSHNADIESIYTHIRTICVVLEAMERNGLRDDDLTDNQKIKLEAIEMFRSGIDQKIKRITNT